MGEEALESNELLPLLLLLDALELPMPLPSNLAPPSPSLSTRPYRL